MDTKHVTATYTPSSTKQWAIFRIDGLVLNLHGQQMENLLNGDVMIFSENSHHALWVSTASGNTKRFEEFFGRPAYHHLVALALRREKSTGSLDALQLNLQRAVEAKLAHQHRRHYPAALAI